MPVTRKPDIGELDQIRLLVPLELYGTSDDIKRLVPAGSVGTVMLVFDRGAAFETEFVLPPDLGSTDPEYISCTGAVEADQCEKI